MNDRVEGYRYPQRVRFELLEKDLDSYRRAADFLNFNNADVLCVQHEFGIYGGAAVYRCNSRPAWRGCPRPCMGKRRCITRIELGQP